MNETFWITKLLARIHDPGEKALVLLRDRAGHEGGTSAVLWDQLFETGVVTSKIKNTVKRADWWAAAADRPQFPKEDWHKTMVRWTKCPELIHPLSGESYSLGRLSTTDIKDIKKRSLLHFQRLIEREDGKVDHRKTYLAYWRFGPSLVEESDNETLGVLWQQLPADTRIPDHSIWEHLDLTSAFAGAFSQDETNGPALLIVALGPIQPFIEASRSTTDLWAGSHLLSHLAWHAMKVLCEEFGPDSIVFPRLRGIPIVDLWLQEECDIARKNFDEEPWRHSESQDANPLFSAVLPNRFVAIVPNSESQRVVEKIVSAVRQRIMDIGNKVVDRLFDKAGIDGDEYAKKQLKEQLNGFPEIHWSAVPFSLVQIGDRSKQTQLDTSLLQQAMAPYFGVDDGEECGFLASEAWKILQKSKAWDINTEDAPKFFDPNPGVLYPAVYDLANRSLASAKSTRLFDQSMQTGWRCSLTGETEWLTADPTQLSRYYGSNQDNDTLWSRIAKQNPAWAKDGEHLGALAAIKRLWPDIFADELCDRLGIETQRFVVSTHTMALAKQLNNWLENGGNISDEQREEIIKNHKPVALPRKIVLQNIENKEDFDVAKRIPALLDDASEDEYDDVVKKVKEIFKEISGSTQENDYQFETYYALILMDGDRMGKILSSDSDSNYSIQYKESFHEQIRKMVNEKADLNDDLREYVNSKRAMSPGRHIAISAALNDFSLHVVPEIVEREFSGRVIYAGGDDVLAMLPVADLLPAMYRVRKAYSGTKLEPKNGSRIKNCNKGFILLRDKKNKENQLLRMLGTKATASCGAVVAHHKTPLSVVLRELRMAENQAKTEGNRDAYSITIAKRSGGALHLTDKWDSSFELLQNLCDFFSKSEVSRRVSYDSLAWLMDIPKNAPKRMIHNLLYYKFCAHTNLKDPSIIDEINHLAEQLAAIVNHSKGEQRLDKLKKILSIAEFFAREVRSTVLAESKEAL